VGVDERVSAMGASSLAAEAVNRGRMVEGSLKKSSSRAVMDEEKPVLKSKRIRSLSMAVEQFDMWGEKQELSLRAL
jgi:hypothetical protein